MSQQQFVIVATGPNATYFLGNVQESYEDEVSMEGDTVEYDYKWLEKFSSRVTRFAHYKHAQAFIDEQLGADASWATFVVFDASFFQE